MSTDTTGAAQSPPTDPPAGSSAVSVGVAGVWRRVRGPLAFLVGASVLGVLVSLNAVPSPIGDLDPEGANPDGSRALVQILRDDFDVPVTIARDTDEAVAAAGADSVLVLVKSHRLTAGELDRLAGLPGDRLLVQPTTQAIKALAPGVEVTGRGDDRDVLSPECTLEAARTAGDARTGGELYSGASTACYPAEGGSALVRTDSGDATVTILGSGDPMRNRFLAYEGNAALMINLLAGDGVVWFLPDVPSTGGASDPVDLLHPGFLPGAGMLLAALLLLALWRGRRLGPLVAERLPVVVRASETTEGRARLYTARRARPNAAEALRSGALSSVRPRLGLGTETAPEAVVEAVSQRSPRDPEQIRALLYGGPSDPYTADDTALVRLADELDALDREVRE
ncbi:DUF4350 domain-containing protein [Nocardiopsis ansamitocini]|uniref:DUF4350 domain-containing protein n=1 Tax=Nocardiopsis ansamitocini TaxID=1670832 RepID=A0A9W6P9U2_9ACTN|nr:DUF4350 domain-containing protein [Nocardiopsis ansamitocini]GLU49662.1 hypothetical protein Nans01_40130 [Nocardiopsis ansamitocini]